MEKLKRFIDCTVPVVTCNLRCPYCYITQERKFLNALPTFRYTPEQIGKALSQERMGGVVHFNLCGGGETLLPPEIIAISREILAQGHYIAIITNGTATKRFKEICQFPEDYRERILFKFSFHYLELKKRKLLDKFFDNVNMMRQAGCSISVELTPSDIYIPYIQEIKDICMDKVGALCHVTVARKETDPELPILTELSREDYIKTWSQFDSDMFKFKMQTFNVKRREFCYGGLWTGHLNLGTGILRQCYCGAVIQNLFEDPGKPIKWEPIGNYCAEPHCHNAHVWLTLGAIPELETPEYTLMRNRVCKDGTEWLTPRMKSFLSQKLADNNVQLTEGERKLANKASHRRMIKTQLIRKPLRKIYMSLPDKMKIWAIKHIPNKF